MKKVICAISTVIISAFLMTTAADASTLLKAGSRGSEVKTVQTQLSILGYNAGYADGIFGSRTKAAVISFQIDHRIEADGIVGPVTHASLNWCVDRYYKTAGIISAAKSLIGVPYTWGGTSPSGFDCSGFTKYIFAKQGITLPRTSRDQYGTGTHISYGSLRPGDLVFFSLGSNGQVSHVGIYVGNGQFINATTSRGVTISSFTSYWTNIYAGASRVY